MLEYYQIPAAVLAASVAYVAYYCFFHPLARVPGPFLAKLTRLWIFFYTR